MRRLAVPLVALFCVLSGFSLAVIAQGPIGPFANTAMRSSAGALEVAPQGTCGTLGPITNGANVPVRSSAGALHVCGDFGGSAAGSDTQVQFNDGGTNFGGDADFIWDKTLNKLVIGSTTNDGSLTLNRAGNPSGFQNFRLEIDSLNGGRFALRRWNDANDAALASILSFDASNAFVIQQNATIEGTLASTTYRITPTSATGTAVNDAGTLRRQVYAVTVVPAAFTCAAVTCDVTLGTLPAKSRLVTVGADLTQTFACTATCTSSTLSMTVGTSAGGTQVLASFDADAATAYFGDADAELGTGMTRAAAIQGGLLPSTSGTTTVSVRLTSGTGNIGNGSATNLSQGSVRFVLVVEIVS